MKKINVKTGSIMIDCAVLMIGIGALLISKYVTNNNNQNSLMIAGGLIAALEGLVLVVTYGLFGEGFKKATRQIFTSAAKRKQNALDDEAELIAARAKQKRIAQAPATTVHQSRVSHYVTGLIGLMVLVISILI